MCSEPIENLPNEYEFNPLQAQPSQGESEPEIISIDYVKTKKPYEAYGDLHITPDGFYFLSFCKAEPWKQAIYANLGLIGAWFEHQASKKRKQQMAVWRTTQEGKYLDELIQTYQDSMFIPIRYIKLIKSAFISTGVVIEHGNNEKFVIETPSKEVKKILAFARNQNWPVK